MEIQIDNERILNEGKYTVSEFTQFLDGLFSQEGLYRDNSFLESLLYYGTEPKKDFARVGYMYASLKRNQEFLRYCKKWFWLEYESLDRDYADGYGTDILSKIRKDSI
jgi:hypothetical protein